MEPSLTDRFGRSHTYLRISLTDKCNFRCTYCMPVEDMTFMPSSKLMSADEIISLAGIFTEMGVIKIRLTGGEPTVRKDLYDILSGLSALPAELTMTTNGLHLEKHLDTFLKNGITGLNISLDTLNRQRFMEITRRNHLEGVLQGIKSAVNSGMKIKVNAVIMRGVNDDEILAMLKWADQSGVEMRFIEYMPFFGNQWEYEKVVRRDEILDMVRKEFRIESTPVSKDSTAACFKVEGMRQSFGIISTISNPFCNGCSRIRLTADGKVKNCLFSSDETDILSHFRMGHDVKPLITQVVERKKFSAAGKIDFKDELARTEYAKNRAMISIGG